MSKQKTQQKGKFMDPYKCFLVLHNSDKVSKVELPFANRPTVGETKSISSAEVRKGPQPDGQMLGGYLNPRTAIQIVADLGEQEHFGEKLPTFEYIRGSL